MSVQIVVCDGCGKTHDECACLIEFYKHGITVHLCDECIDKAKKIIERKRGK